MKKLEKILSVLSGMFLVALFVLCLLQVLFRFVIRISAPFTEEFARMSYIWMVFLMLPVLESKDEQMKVTYFLGKFPQKLQMVIYWIMSAFYVLFLLLLTLGSFRMVTTSTTVTFASTPWLKVNYQYIPILIGSVLAIAFVIARVLSAREVLNHEQMAYEVEKEKTELPEIRDE